MEIGETDPPYDKVTEWKQHAQRAMRIIDVTNFKLVKTETSLGGETSIHYYEKGKEKLTVAYTHVGKWREFRLLTEDEDNFIYPEA